MAVLEAVHLLLAFPLFVVVVGVDPRWLRHALAEHYPHTLTQNGQAHGASTQHPRATPQDYLEKIFQIPFALRSVEQDGYDRLVSDLLAPLPERRHDEVMPPPNGTKPSTTTSTPDGVDTSGKPLVPPKQLDFTRWEERDIKQLWPLFSTPRTVKRFINTYRLLRAGLTERETCRI